MTGRVQSHEWEPDLGCWSCRCGAVCDQAKPCGRHGSCKGTQGATQDEAAAALLHNIFGSQP